jgi:hypothetical protein
MAFTQYRIKEGKATVSNGSATATVIAAQGAGKIIRPTWGILTVTTAATGGGGLVSLKSGSTTIISYPANAADTYYIEWGDDGYPWDVNTGVTIVAESAVSNQATAFIAMMSIVVG